MCSDAPPPPDFTPIANAMKEIGGRMESLGNRQMAFAQQRYEETMPFYQRMVASNLEGQRLAMQMARENAQDRQGYRALENQMLSEAMNQDRSQMRNLYAGRSAADVEQAMSTARSTAVRNLSRMGINPNAARFADLNNQIALQGAAMKAGAMTNARMGADQMYEAKRINAMNIGRNMPATQLSAIGTGANVGGSTSAMFNNQSAPMFQGYQGAMQGMQGNLAAQSGIGNMMNQGYQNQVAAYNAENAGMAGLGQLVGAGMSFFSSEDMKKDKASIGRGKALDAVRNMPVESWRYKEGVADGGQHVGPYAEDFKRETGLGTGKQIQAQDAIGIALGAIKDLDAKIDALRDGKRMAGGGSVRGKKNKDGRGGAIRGPGTGTSDEVQAKNKDTGEPIRLSNGEYILPADTVRKVGKAALDKLVEDTHKPVRKSAIGKGK